ncbi:unnamed protein product [Allacma fusca]|uniref:HAT C-terminal dimerisation domain-containing protein n=1 Tax=Allacma fusca TaxID=39272 RepID=A0A8J2PJ46_9HEXA|nr:unnamed protein product [Allacma fusca]
MRYPFMYQAVRQVFVNQISTATVERTFSKLGYWLSPRRNRIKMRTLHLMLLLSENTALLDSDTNDESVLQWRQYHNTTCLSHVDDTSATSLAEEISDWESPDTPDPFEDVWTVGDDDCENDCDAGESDDSFDAVLLVGSEALERVVML